MLFVFIDRIESSAHSADEERACLTRGDSRRYVVPFKSSRRRVCVEMFWKEPHICRMSGVKAYAASETAAIEDRTPSSLALPSLVRFACAIFVCRNLVPCTPRRRRSEEWKPDDETGNNRNTRGWFRNAPALIAPRGHTSVWKGKVSSFAQNTPRTE